MLKSFLLSLVLLISVSAYCQKSSFDIKTSLAGEWTGSYETNRYKDISGTINLYFKPVNDTGYNVYSYSKGEDTTIVCQVYCKILGKNSIYLEETKILLPQEISSGSCLQTMNLILTRQKKEIKLSGTWRNMAGSDCKDSGTIRFIKKTE